MSSPRESFLKSQEIERGLTGLHNIGNTCFLNSVIQCLSNTKPLLEYLLDQEYLSDIKNATKCALVTQFVELIRSIWNDQRRAVNPYPLKSALALYAPRFSGYRQEDAQEFLKYLLEGLHNDINRAVQRSSPTTRSRNYEHDSNDPNESLTSEETWRRYLSRDNSKIVDLFAGLLRSVLRCTHCGTASTIYEPFWDLSLSIPSGVNGSLHQFHNLHLYHCLNLFTKEETLDGNEKPSCLKCKTKQTCTKRISIERFPKILVISLKRFSSGGLSFKVNRLIEFPLEDLNMDNYSTESNLHTVRPMYDLYGIVNHYGTCQYGHYKAVCKHPYSSKWHCFNDSTVTATNINIIDKSDAYILFYELKN